MEIETPNTVPIIWTNILKKNPAPKMEKAPVEFTSAAANIRQIGVVVGSCDSSKGIGIAVVDANAIIQGDKNICRSADRFVTVSDVVNEIRDPSSRNFLNLLPFAVDTLEPSDEALKKVVSFARATGDLQTLSDVDLKLIALTYTLESQIHGKQHLRETPPPIHTVNVKRLPEKDLPGWGSNVPNLEEWEALEHEFDRVSNLNSRILPVKDLNLSLNSDDQHIMENVSSRDDNELCIESQVDGDVGLRIPRKSNKSEVKLEEKKIVADGVDASQGQFDGNDNEWQPAVCRSTRRRYMRRKARREMNMGSSDNADPEDISVMDPDNAECPALLIDECCEVKTDVNFDKVGVNTNDINEDLSGSFSILELAEEPEMTLQNENKQIMHPERIYSGHEEAEITVEELRNSERTSQNGDTSQMDDLSSEQSWTLRSLSESSVACITGDFAMQNVLLQMGLRLLAPGGMQIRELNRWVLKCHACFKVTTDIGRIFCPNCGNGGTLRKVAVTVGENGIVLAGRKPRISLRGTKFSLPFPQSGRDAVLKNPVLREDQLPSKYLYPKIKKKNKQEDDMFLPDNVFSHHTGKKSHQPPVRKALAVFSGKRNPNDNHFSRPKC